MSEFTNFHKPDMLEYVLLLIVSIPNEFIICKKCNCIITTKIDSH